ncbi:tRNA pseudouridine(38-40) synthase TruA [Hydrogenivirga sp. 128-5-R1-1]|uniref:tRNA pseudouridine(38-40) synthase TruA n=1 Tax=Hydrogenivirga sp. 128-5-R1-1 TaxID=392423 RepID=UPI00015EF8FD|nr:tRNA pseudouridine(38-40) synthase TruA [Hydrogenivirga sp. 128-5-R1-1]EDP74552.1 pseudouridine synthase I [Hydrogenivirga sp. 128-5-R1-1]
MNNYMLRLAFVGTNYSGWQIQPGVPTVQGTLKEALETVFGEEIRVIGCCRTDAGVHAEDYVANFRSIKELECEKLLRALNSLLPKDIGVYEVKLVDENFNSRYSVKGKTYLYRLWNSFVRNPFLYPFSWSVTRRVDLNLLSEALEIVSGRHDFRGFAKLEEDKTTVIELETKLAVSGDLIELRFTASHFLRYMVRRLVGAIVKRAEGKVSTGELYEYLKGKHCPHTAPAKGLTLERVHL